jgi:hypothetical protein
VWRLLAALNARQLRALTACRRFFDLPHTEAPSARLGPAALEAMLEVRGDGRGPFFVVCVQFRDA